MYVNTSSLNVAAFSTQAVKRWCFFIATATAVAKLCQESSSDTPSLCINIPLETKLLLTNTSNY